MVNISIKMDFEKFVEVSKRILPHWREYSFNPKANTSVIVVTDTVYDNVYTLSYNKGVAHFYGQHLNKADSFKMIKELEF